MKRFLSIAMALCIGLTMAIDANAAKRFKPKLCVLLFVVRRL